MSYMYAFAAAVPTAEKDAYIAHLRDVGPIFTKHGAEGVVEGWGVDVPPGQLTSFPLAVKCEANETVVLSFIQWPSKAKCDEGMAAAMEDLQQAMGSGSIAMPPFDGKRAIFGGFEVLDIA